ncbi:MAG: hypothetical protein Q7S43_05105 [bacterium]|nr:hypothetical protein [bacterium]
MTNVAVALPNPINGKDLLNLIMESAQEALGDVEIKIKARGGYLPDLKQKDFIGSMCIVTFSIKSVQKVQSFWSSSGYKTKEEEDIFNMMLGTALGGDYEYNVVEFNFFTEYRRSDGQPGTNHIDINDTKYISLRDRFEEFLMVLYSKLNPREAEQSVLSRRVGTL